MSTENDSLARALTEQLRDDMLRVLMLSESRKEGVRPEISVVARDALRISDAFLLAQDQTHLPLEPVTAASVLRDAAHDLEQLAKRTNTALQVDIRGTTRPILGHKQSLRDLMVLVGASLLRQNSDQYTHLVLGTHRSAHGTVMGVFQDQDRPNHRPARLYVQQRDDSAPLQNSDVLLAVAGRLSERMDTVLKSCRHNTMHGVGATFGQSHQLQLVP